MSAAVAAATNVILDYEPPEPGWQPNLGNRGGLDDLLQTQCTHRHTRGRRKGRRCRQVTWSDYRLCDEHLAVHRHLKVGVSSLPGAGFGLFATTKKKSAKVAIFRRGDVIGCFGGELIDNSEYARRYASSGGFARYVVGLGPEKSHDESYARTAISYANDGVCLSDSLMRRNYIYKGGTHVVWHLPEWKHVINCVCELSQSLDGHARARLTALGDIFDGDELLWSYSGSHLPSKEASGSGSGEVVWSRDASGQVIDAYWFGAKAAE